MKIILLTIMLTVILVLTSCETATTPIIENPSKAMSQMTNAELSQMADRYQQLAMSSRRTTATTAYATLSSVYQNEIIIRQLKEYMSLSYSKR